MGQLALFLVVGLTVAVVVFGVTVLIGGRDPGLVPVEPDGWAVPLPGHRPLVESDIADVRFDTTVRGYRMAQVDQALRRAAYDIGYKEELIGVLEAEIIALREGRVADADALRRAREAALAPAGPTPAGADSAPASTSPTGREPVPDKGGGTGSHAGIGIGAPTGAGPDAADPSNGGAAVGRERADGSARFGGATVPSERR